MKKTKEQKGITLIALIITIVVLMILAAVAINSITNDGIIGKAESVKNTYTEKVNEEQKMLDYYEALLAGTAWTQNGTTVSRNGQTLNVGEAVKIKVGEELKTYKELGYDGENATYTGEWVVLGAEYGKLLLVSASNVVESVNLGGANGGNINGTECVAGYNNGVAKLNEICSSYLNTTYADSARSIKAEDINRVTGFVPSSYSGYGTTYTYTTENIVDFEIFVHPDGRKIGENGVTSIDVTNTRYSYRVDKFITDTTDSAYVALFSNNANYWLASQCTETNPDYVGTGIAFFGLHWIADAIFSYGELFYSSMELNYWDQPTRTSGVRAVVSLIYDVQVEKV